MKAFLIEATPIIQNVNLEVIGQEMLSAKWDDIAQQMWKLNETGNTILLDNMFSNIMKVYNIEVEVLSRLQNII